MNIPEIYLVEPYNAYAPKGRKKHWHEIVEEQALMARIVAEQMALQEAQTSKTLPPNSPATATPTVGGIPQAGGGGVPVYAFFHPEGDVADFSFTPSTGVAPFSVAFTNLTDTPEFDIYLWVFGDGTTSTDTNPVHVYQTGSNNPTYYTASLQVSHSANPSVTQSISKYITASVPQITASFTYITSSGPGPTLVTFTNATKVTGSVVGYNWYFGDGASSSLSSPTHTYDTGSFTASLQATASYGIASKYTQSFVIPAPTLTAGFTFTTSSKTAPSTATFLNTINGAGGTQYNGHGTLQYFWQLGSGSLTATTTIPNPTTYKTAGGYTASLQVTESSYGIMSSYAVSWSLA